MRTEDDLPPAIELVCLSSASLTTGVYKMVDGHVDTNVADTADDSNNFLLF